MTESVLDFEGGIVMYCIVLYWCNFVDTGRCDYSLWSSANSAHQREQHNIETDTYVL